MQAHKAEHLALFMEYCRNFWFNGKLTCHTFCSLFFSLSLSVSLSPFPLLARAKKSCNLHFFYMLEIIYVSLFAWLSFLFQLWSQFRNHQGRTKWPINTRTFWPMLMLNLLIDHSRKMAKANLKTWNIKNSLEE